MVMCRLHHSLLLLVVAWRTCNRYLTTSTPQTLKKNKKRNPKRSTKRLENFLSLSFSLHVTPLLTFPTSTLAPPASTPTHTHTRRRTPPIRSACSASLRRPEGAL